MFKVAAGIVLFNPDLNRLKKNIDAVYSQVVSVYCFDNGSSNIKEIRKLLNSYPAVRLIDGKINKGIPKALNQILRYAYSDSVEWLLTLDQDSVVSDNMISNLCNGCLIDRCLIVCPVIVDKRRKNIALNNKKNGLEEVNFCITSGSLMNVKKTLELGGFDEFLFIGFVDNEICMRARINGYKIILNNDVILDHELGKLKPSRFEKQFVCIGNLLHSELIKKLSYHRYVNPLRVYYGNRNAFYLNKKFSDYPEYMNYKYNIFKEGISTLIRGHFNPKVIKALLHGIKDGICIKSDVKYFPKNREK